MENGGQLEGYSKSLNEPSPEEQTLFRESLASYKGDENAVTTKPYTRTSFGIPLYTYDGVPGFLKGNPHVICGYRAQLPFNLCIKR